MEYAPLVKGLICPIVTPLLDDRRLDRTGLVRLLSYVTPHVQALAVGHAFWGEGAALPLETKQELIRTVWEVVDRPFPLYLGVTGRSAEETVLLTRWIEAETKRYRISNPLVLMDYPLWYHSNRGLPRFLEQLLKEDSLPLLLGNDARFILKRHKPIKRKNILASVLRKIGDNPGIVGMVHSGSAKRLFEYRGALGNRKDFLLYDGDERVFVATPSRSGVLALSSNVFPSEWNVVVRVTLSSYRQDEDGDPEMERACNILERLQRFWMLNPKDDVQTIKAILVKRRILTTALTTPLFPVLNNSKIKEIERALSNDRTFSS